ncbi:MAG TPA: tRNA (guanosine(37)-N1)-methyltransferase TrmD [Acidimicrobiales bacterium]|nr:tRNA (guanosine(37)-N1)-methyltransferase TrmD [Acidimicrobiales bacterium]
MNPPAAPVGPRPPGPSGPRLRVDVFTIFPPLVENYCAGSLLGRARHLGLLDLRIHDLRSAATDPRRSVDDTPFGGGAGMVLAPGPIFGAVELASPPRPLLLLAPGGRRLEQPVVEELVATGSSPSGGFSLLCGRYEGVDQRVSDHLVDGELSIGDYVLAGGEAAAIVVVEAVTRLLPGVMGNADSAAEESFGAGLLEYPQYTRPAEFRGWEVPEVLRTGDHGAIARWRRAMALRRTQDRRPDLLASRGGLSEEERHLVDDLADDLADGRTDGGPDGRTDGGPADDPADGDRVS